MNKKRVRELQNLTARTASPGQPIVVEGSPDPGPYKVRRVFLQVEAELLTPDGKVKDIATSQPVAIVENDFFPGLVEFLRSKGIKVGDNARAENSG